MLQRSAGVVLAVALLLFLLQRSRLLSELPLLHRPRHHTRGNIMTATHCLRQPSTRRWIHSCPYPRSARHRRSPGPGSSTDHRQGLNQKTGHTSLHPYPKPTTPRRPPTGPRPRQGFLPPGRRQHISPLLLLLLYGGQSPFSHPAPRIINQKNIQNKCNSRS